MNVSSVLKGASTSNEKLECGFSPAGKKKTLLLAVVELFKITIEKSIAKATVKIQLQKVAITIFRPSCHPENINVDGI